MTFADLMSVVGAILLAFGGGAVILVMLSRWLGGIWAKRILATEDANRQRDFEALVRRRDIYSRLAVNLRVFLDGTTNPREQLELRQEFLKAYDEAAVWAPDNVMNALGLLLDLTVKNAQGQLTSAEPDRKKAYIECITQMRKDSGFPDTRFDYRVVGF